MTMHYPKTKHIRQFRVVSVLWCAGFCVASLGISCFYEFLRLKRGGLTPIQGIFSFNVKYRHPFILNWLCLDLFSSILPAGILS